MLRLMSLASPPQLLSLGVKTLFVMIRTLHSRGMASHWQVWQVAAGCL